MELVQWKLLPLLTLFLSAALFYIKRSSEDSPNNCSLLPSTHYWIASKRIVTPNGVISAAVEINHGIITSIVEEAEWRGRAIAQQVIDYGEAVVMPGLVDVHAHLDEPGRTEWEGFLTGTKSAAAGGITTLIDMPLNSQPSTVSRETLKLKTDAAKGKIFVDVGFWGGLVPENALNSTALEDLLDAGVLGLKSFMCPSGINDFPMTNITHIQGGLTVLAKYKRPLLVHAELVQESDETEEDDTAEATSYSTYLKTRPASWYSSKLRHVEDKKSLVSIAIYMIHRVARREEAAIRELVSATKETRTGGSAEGAHLHIVHLSDAGSSLDLIKEAKTRGDSLTVETCPHYLAFSAEEIPDRDTRFKCSPPIRNAANKEKLWEAVMGGHIDLLSSDHSPSVPELKRLDNGNFLEAWGGISSLQFVLPVTWSHGRKYSLALKKLATLWSEKPAKLAGQKLKGAIAVGNHADLAVWEPEVEFELNTSHPVFHKHPSISAYMGKTLSGRVIATFVRGNLIFKEGTHAAAACGATILAN